MFEKNIRNVIRLYGEGINGFSLSFSIPYRTVQSWYEGKRKPPDYVVDLLLTSVLCKKGYCIYRDKL